MPLVRFTGWREGLNKVELNRLIRSHTGLGLDDAKRVVDRLLDGESPTVLAEPGDNARALITEAEAIGAAGVLEHIGSVEFRAEIVAEPALGDVVVRFAYIMDSSTELAITHEWWDDLGRPEVIYVAVKPDPDR